MARRRAEAAASATERALPCRAELWAGYEGRACGGATDTKEGEFYGGVF